MIYDFKVNDFINPILVDDTPVFSWKIVSDKTEVFQTGYQILVKDEKGAAVWDSGRIKSDKQISILYEGNTLKPFEEYLCEIKVWDNKGDEHSGKAGFRTGIISQNNWQGKWICAQSEDKIKTLPIFQKELELSKDVKEAYFYATAHGMYDPMIDGKKISDGFFAPGWTSYQYRLQYQVYDVTDFIRDSSHTIQMLVGPGWYKGYLNVDGKNCFYGDTLAVNGMLVIKYKDGSTEIIGTDESWQVKESNIIDSEIYHGETIDFTKSDFNILGVKLLEESADVKFVAQLSEPVRITETIEPKKIIKTPKGETVIEFGQNIAGFVRVKCHKTSKKNTITIRHAEVLDKDGNFYTENLRTAKATDRYTYDSGHAEREIMPHFTYHGFRYIAVEGCENLTDNELMTSFTACVLHTDMSPIGTFNCNNEEVNRLYENVKWSERNNFVDIPTDCPQRDERLGWTGDAAIFCETSSYIYNTKAFFRKWIGDVALETDDEHGVPHIVPSIEGKAVGTAVWSDVATIVPWTLYMEYGDRQLLKKQYPLMKQWVKYIDRNADDNHLWMRGFQRGDWLSLDGPACIKGDKNGATDKNLVANVYYAISTKMVRDSAKELGLREDYDKFAKSYENIVDAINEEFVTKTGRLVSETQASCALLLHYGLLKEEYAPRVTSTFKEQMTRYKNHLTTGFVGTSALLHALSENGMHDVAQSVFFAKDYPGWFYGIERGATTIWERWDGINENGEFDKSGMNSFNHYSYGTVADWINKKIVGINSAAPGYKKIIIKPTLTHGLWQVSGSLESPYGRISCSYLCKDGKIRLEAEIPACTTAEIILPVSNEKKLVGSGKYAYEYNTDVVLDRCVYSMASTFGDIIDGGKSEVLLSIMPELSNAGMLSFLKGKTLGEISAMSEENAGRMKSLIERLNC